MKRTLILVLSFILATAAFARPQRGPEGNHGREGRAGRAMLPPQALAEFLSLSDAQTSQIEALRETLKSTIQPLREQQRANRQALEAALESGDSAKAGQLSSAIYATGNQIKAAADSYQTSFAALLTAEQKAKWAVYQEIIELRGKAPRRPPQE